MKSSRFSKNPLFHNFGLKLASFGVGVILWAVVLGSRNVEETKDVPIEIITPSDLIVSNDVPDKINFRVSGPKAFLRTLLDRKEDPIRVNLTGAKAGVMTYRFFSDHIKLPIGMKVLSVNPAAVLIKLEYLKRKDIPIKADLRGKLGEGLNLARVEVSPEIVRVKGPESKIDSLSEILTEPIDLSKVTESFEKNVSIDLQRSGISIEGELPKVRIELEGQQASHYRIKNVAIFVKGSKAKLKLEPAQITVYVKANAEDLKTLDRTKVYAEVDANLIKSGKPKMLPVRVKAPSNIQIIRAVPDVVQVSLEGEEG